MRLLVLLGEGGQDGFMRLKVGLVHLGEGGQDGVPSPSPPGGLIWSWGMV